LPALFVLNKDETLILNDVVVEVNVNFVSVIMVSVVLMVLVLVEVLVVVDVFNQDSSSPQLK